MFLDAAGIRNRIVRGFYLKRKKDPEKAATKILIPIPHRWIEICLSDRVKIFYDPQYQDFSANYLTTRVDINFSEISKFTAKVIKISKGIINK